MKQEVNTLMDRARSGYGIKLVLIAVLLVCFIPPLAMIGRIINDRAFRSDSAQNEIIESWGGRAGISGPYLLVPVSKVEWQRNEEGDAIQRTSIGTVVLFPEVLSTQIEATTEIRNRGIFSVPVFTADAEIAGSFDLSRIPERLPAWTVHWDETDIGLNVQQLKGLQGIYESVADGREVVFEPSTDLGVQWGEAITAALPLEGVQSGAAPGSDEATTFDFHIALGMNGGGSISVMPVGRRTEVEIRSDWPSPSFFGSSLPVQRDYSEEGFTANWGVSYLSRSLPALVVLRDGDPGSSYVEPFGVELFQPDDPYARNERSFKYSWLFLIVPFLTFFLFEVIRKRRIHVGQYVLAGSADVVFYLLLLSISEQLVFMAAYLVAAGAITLLLTAYGTTVLRGMREGLLLGAMIGLGYGYLAVVLQSEDYALLLGSVGLFIVLAAVMYLTRDIAWYGRDEEESREPIQQASEPSTE